MYVLFCTDPYICTLLSWIVLKEGKGGGFSVLVSILVWATNMSQELAVLLTEFLNQLEKWERVYVAYYKAWVPDYSTRVLSWTLLGLSLFPLVLVWGCILYFCCQNKCAKRCSASGNYFQLISLIWIQWNDNNKNILETSYTLFKIDWVKLQIPFCNARVFVILTLT